MNPGKWQSICAVVVILAMGWWYHAPYINEFPSYIHAWAQSDRYALAIGFIDNGLNFFNPENLIYNHQFPHQWTVPSDHTETAVGFPIHDYIPAVMMSVIGDHSPWIFRSYILLYSFVGLFFLYRLAHLITGDFYRSLFVVIFGATSPVFVYYQGGFLPTIPALANAVIGIYLYLKYRKHLQRKYFMVSMAFLTLATLSRLPFVIPLSAVLILEVCSLVNRKRIYDKSTLITIVGSIVLILGSTFHTAGLRERYGSDFLSSFMTAGSITEAVNLVKIAWVNWGIQYFSVYHYLLLVLLILTAVFFLKRKGRYPVPDQFQIKLLGAIVLLIYAGVGLYSILMLRQFPVHDYYFLDTFFLPGILVVLLCLSIIPQWHVSTVHSVTSLVALCIIGIPLIKVAHDSQSKRRITQIWDRGMATIRNFEGAGAFLDSIDIEQNARILALDANIPNVPFLLMERKGYPVMTTTRENIKEALTWNFDYIVVQNDYFISDIFAVYPDIIHRIHKIADNRKISLFKLSDSDDDQKSLTAFWGLENKDQIFHAVMDYESVEDSGYWKNVSTTTDTVFSGSASGVLEPDKEFGLTFSHTGIGQLLKRPGILIVSTALRASTLQELFVVVDLEVNGEKKYYRTINVANFMEPTAGWEQVELLYQFPEIESDDVRLNIYVWNKGKNQLYLDDFTISVY